MPSESGLIYGTTLPVYCTYLTLGDFKTLKITSPAVNEHLFQNKHKVTYILFVHNFCQSRVRNKCSKCCPSARTKVVKLPVIYVGG